MVYEISEGSPSISSKGMGRNIRQNLKPKSYFLLDTNIGFTQNLNEKFGVIGNGVNSVFRTTSKIIYTGKVFAICQGQVFIQPNPNSDKVNIILKPFSQPIKGLSIKYFIYRGLNKSDFFSTDNKVLASGNDFITFVRNDFNSFYQYLNITVPPFLAEYLGYPSSNPSLPIDQQQKTTDLIDEYFFKISKVENGNETTKTAYDFPIVPAGIHLGNIAGSMGIDIVLDDGDFILENDPNPFQLNLGFARLAENILDPATASTLYEKKLLKESAADFIDIAAFYGLHSNEKGKIYTENSTANSKDEIYNLISNFKTSNTLYLYVQSNRQRSYNYYGNYKTVANKNIKIGYVANSLQEETFETEGWPIKIINDITQDKFFLSLLSKRMYRGNLFFIEAGSRSGASKKNNFIIEKDYVDESLTTDLNYTIPIEFEISGIATINKFVYLGSDVSFVDVYNTTYPHYSYIKELYPLINIKNKFSESDMADVSKVSFLKNAAINLSDYSNTQYHSTIQNQMVFYNGKKKDGDSFIEKRKVLFLSKKKDSLDSLEVNDTLSVFGTTSGFSIKENSNDDYLKFLIYGSSEFSAYYKDIIDENETIRVLNLKKAGRNDGTFLSLGITEQEFEQIKSIIPQNAANVRFFLDSMSPSPRVDINNIGYYKYSLGVSYESELGLNITFPTSQVYVYGIRLDYLCSKEFSEYEWDVENNSI